jgi:fatty acid desaturase
MTNDQPPVFPRIAWDLKTPRRVIQAELGVETLRRLHQPSRVGDAALLVFTFALIAVSTAGLVLLPFGPLWCVAGLFQQLGTMNCLYSVRHDLFFHRRVAGELSDPLGVLCSFLLFGSFAKFLYHEDHHNLVGWDLVEEPVAHLDRRWKRWLCLTGFGAALLLAGKLRSPDAPRPNESYVAPASFLRRLRREQVLHRLFAAALIVGAILKPGVFAKGLLLPVFLFAPIIVMIRVVFQHAETDPHNPFHVAVYHRPVWLLRVLFFDTIGAGHLVHHLYPHIPIYRVGEAARLMHPVLARHDVPERGLGETLWHYFVRGEPYRVRWGAVARQPEPGR